jgi:hypothetical protein
MNDEGMGRGLEKNLVFEERYISYCIARVMGENDMAGCLPLECVIDQYYYTGGVG